MRTIASLFKRLSSADQAIQEIIPANPSEILRVNREDISGTLEIRRINEEEEDPSKVLRISWIKRDSAQGIMKTVWINNELEVL